MSENIWLTEWIPEDPIDLDTLKDIITKLQVKYGKRAVLHLDAGYNNICAHIQPTKKIKESS